MDYFFAVFLLLFALYGVPRQAFKRPKGISLIFIIAYSVVYFMLLVPRVAIPPLNPVGLILGLCLWISSMKFLFDKPVSFDFIVKIFLMIAPPILLAYYIPARNGFHVVDGFILIFVVHYVAARYWTLPIITDKNLLFEFDVIYKTLLLTLLIIFRSFREIDVGFNFSFNFQNLTITIVTALGLMITCTIMAIQLQFLKLQTPKIKLPEISTIFVLMFLFVALPEEFIFRGLLYNYLSQYIACWGNIIPWLLSSLTFGIAHFRGGWKMIALAAMAGCFYCFVYWKTGNIFYAALIHTLTNVFRKYGLTAVQVQKGADF